LENYNEDDQILELKAWWNEYGRSIVAGIVLAVLSVGGWNFWNQHTTKQAEQASTIYYSMTESYRDLERLTTQENQSVNKESGEKLAKLGEFQESLASLKEQYTNTEYAQYASMLNAKYLVSQGDFLGAENELREALKRGGSKSIQHLISLRLARILFANEKFDDALKLAAAKNPGNYESAFQELAGDIYFKQSENQKAFLAYSKAKEISEQPSEELEMKYYNLLEK
jgi:predicted negative regulator of RcsB-dependent stress response